MGGRGCGAGCPHFDFAVEEESWTQILRQGSIQVFMMNADFFKLLQKVFRVQLTSLSNLS